MLRRALLIAVFVSLFATTGAAQERAPRVEALSAIGARTVAELAPVAERAQSLLTRCRVQSRAVGGDAAALIRLTIDARGRVVTATVLAEGDVSEPARRWHRCATRALSRLRFGAGASGSIELVARWTGGEVTPAVRAERGDEGEESGIRGPGSLPAEVIQGVVRRHSGEVRSCYERARENEPALTGRLVVTWTIARDGSVSDVSNATDTLGSAAMSDCITGVIRRWTFPVPDGGTMRVTFPFVFGSMGGG